MEKEKYESTALKSEEPYFNPSDYTSHFQSRLPQLVRHIWGAPADSVFGIGGGNERPVNDVYNQERLYVKSIVDGDPTKEARKYGAIAGVTTLISLLALPGPVGRAFALSRMRRTLSRPDLTMSEMVRDYTAKRTTTGNIVRNILRFSGSVLLSGYAGASVYRNNIELGDIGRKLADLPLVVPKEGSLVCDELCPDLIKMYQAQVNPQEDGSWIPPAEDTNHTDIVRDVVQRFVRNCEARGYGKK